MKILITGATGTIGNALCAALLLRAHSVAILTRSAKHTLAGVETYLWNVSKGEIDADCIQGVDVIIHLAGRGIADGNWSASDQQEVIDSRTQSISLIHQLLKENPHQVRKIISASGVGYYGGDNGDVLLNENQPAGTDFLGKCCVLWEDAVKQCAADIQGAYCIFRTGVVISNDGGAFPKLMLPIRFFVGVSIGHGRQKLPWVHIQDVIQVYVTAVETSLEGVFNLNAPEVVDFKTFCIKAAQRIHRPFWPISVPSALLRLLMGEKSILVLGSTNASSRKLQEEGFCFQFPDLTSALKDLLP